MKTIYQPFLILVLLVLSLTQAEHAFALTPEEEITLEQTLQANGESLTFDEEQSLVTETQNMSLVSVSEPKDCLEQIEIRQKKLIKKMLIQPLLGIPVTAGTTLTGYYVGSRIGRLLTPNSLWAQVAGSSIGTTVGFWGSIAFFVTKEVIHLNEFFSNHKLIHLLRGASEQDEGMLAPTLARLKARKVDLSESELSSRVNDLIDQDQICIDAKRNHSYRKVLKLIKTND